MGNNLKKKKKNLIDDDKNKVGAKKASSGIQPKDNKKEENALDANVSYEDFEPIKILGQGSLGTVLLVRLKANQKLYAMKIINNVIKIKGKKTKGNLIANINSPFTVNIEYAFHARNKLYLVSEFMQGGDLFFHMYNTKRGKNVVFNNETTRFYIMELVLSLESLHKINMIYRNLKPEKILLDSKGHIKLANIGIGEIVDNEDYKPFALCEIQKYEVPEIMKRKGYTNAADWFSLGCVMYEMLTGKSPFFVRRGVNIGMKTFEKEVLYPESLDKKAKNLIQKLLILDPKERLGSGPNGTENIKNDPYFEGIDWDDVLNKKIKPPFIPELNSDLDLRYFDKMFTEEPIDEFKLNNINKERERKPSNQYGGLTYVVGCSSHELNHSYKELNVDDEIKIEEEI